MDVAFPTAMVIYDSAADIRAIFGIEITIITSYEFNEKFYDKISG